MVQLVTCALIYDPSDPVKILFVRRARDPCKGQLALVGGCGAFEQVCDPAEAVRREVQCDLSSDLFDVRFLTYYFVPPQSAVLVFVGHLGQNPITVDPHYVSDYLWMDARLTCSEHSIAFDGKRAVQMYLECIRDHKDTP